MPQLTSSPVRRNPLSQEVASHIRERIMLGQIKPGQFIRMEPIAEELGLSITPVREALLSLTGDGFVSAVPRRGFIAESFTQQDIRDIFWAQGQFAGELAARAAMRISLDQLTELEALTVEFERAVEKQDVEASGRAGHRFHRAVNHAADSERLAMLLSSIVKRLPDDFYVSINSDVQTAPEEHRTLLDALHRRDPEGARHSATLHLTRNAGLVIEILAAHGTWAT